MDDGLFGSGNVMVIGVAVFGLLPFCHLIVASSVVVEGAAEGGFCHFRKGTYTFVWNFFERWSYPDFKKSENSAFYQ